MVCVFADGALYAPSSVTAKGTAMRLEPKTLEQRMKALETSGLILSIVTMFLVGALIGVTADMLIIAAKIGM